MPRSEVQRYEDHQVQHYVWPWRDVDPETANQATGSMSPRATQPGHGFLVAVGFFSGIFMVGAGLWALVAPHSFADFADFAPYNHHFLHDLGAFQLGIGVTSLLALIWRDALALGLAGFLVSNTVHAVNHAVDLHLGGHGQGDWIALAVLSLAVAAALFLRLRELGFVVGEVHSARRPDLERFVQQKTVLLTTYRKDGTPVSAPVSLAVDGDRAFIRTFEKAAKVKRLRHNPVVEVTPSTAGGTATGPAIRSRARPLTGPQWNYAAHLLRRKYPVLQGVLVPSGHHLLRGKFGKTMHYELIPLEEPTGPSGAL
jgi:PPOX class probable F420-dependent enzyme